MEILSQSESIEMIKRYEEAIAADPTDMSNYWQLGLLLLLQGQEAEAQMTWLDAILTASPKQADIYTQELLDFLRHASEQQDTKPETAWLICQHIREINPLDAENLLRIVQLSLEMQSFINRDLIDLGLIELFQSQLDSEIDVELDEGLIFSTWQQTLNYCLPDRLIFEFISSSLNHVKNPQAGIDILMPIAFKYGFSFNRLDLAISLAEICLQLDSNNLQILGFISLFNQDAGNYQTGIETAKQLSNSARSLDDQIFANYVLLRGLLISGGNWQDAAKVFHTHEELLINLTKANFVSLSRPTVLNLLSSLFFFPYFHDQAQTNRQIQNQIAALCQANIQQYASELFIFCNSHLQTRNLSKTIPKKLKIGYLCSYFKQHSVGWLARSLFQHCDRNSFEIYTYFKGYQSTFDPVQNWYEQQSDRAYRAGIDGSDDSLAIAKQISDDSIDILVDLDSITANSCCEILAIKPAPIQVTWLGWDASGIPAVDYFIADPYVLPNDAESYYSEKIWRLPHCFIAVDGFEVGVPTLRRSDLDIPDMAIVYLTSQGGYKRHPDTIRNQLQIIKNVPNSYLLIKGFADRDSVANTFLQIASEEEVSSDRLRFLPIVKSEAIHRANLNIADVVLDTYPYNGATTTLETLWMGIPLVTRVGEQFSARNSYTMMINAGITEGIAWSEKEYIDWGIGLGMDANLRQEIYMRLRQNQRTAPVWQGRDFTQKMEDAYRGMWLDSKHK